MITSRNPASPLLELFLLILGCIPDQHAGGEIPFHPATVQISPVDDLLLGKFDRLSALTPRTTRGVLLTLPLKRSPFGSNNDQGRPESKAHVSPRGRAFR